MGLLGTTVVVRTVVLTNVVVVVVTVMMDGDAKVGVLTVVVGRGNRIDVVCPGPGRSVVWDGLGNAMIRQIGERESKGRGVCGASGGVRGASRSTIHAEREREREGEGDARGMDEEWMRNE